MTTKTELRQQEAATLADRFDRDGYVLVSGVYGAERVREVREYLLKVFNEHGAGFFPPVNNMNKGAIFDLFTHHPGLLDMICNEPVAKTLEQLLGANPILLPDAAAHWEYFNKMHTDTTTIEQRGHTFHKAPDYRIVTVGMYLQDNNEAGGGLTLVSGSHNKPDPFVRVRHLQSKLKRSRLKRFLKLISFNRLYNLEKELTDHPQAVDIPTQAGDVIIFDMRIIHRSSYPRRKGVTIPNGGKMAMFVHCSANNPHATSYTDYLKTKKDYDYIHQPRDLDEIKAACGRFGIVAW